MKIRIISFQTDPKCTYHISHHYILFLERRLNEHFSNINTELNLDLSIICLTSNADDLRLGGSTKHREKGTNITQEIVLPNRHLYYEHDYIFYSKKFDFVFKENGYQTYPLDLFASYTIDGILAYLTENNLDVPNENESKLFAHDLMVELSSRLYHFKFENEELMHLRELIDKTHWAFNDEKGKEWLESEIGKKWMKLSEKYSFDENGMLVLKG
ncbi:MAG: hypothetical protein HWE22_00685 [Flavobacteriales bacterium]|nr:hypothetical protein [Flavobacteriales bacterium]